MGGLKKEKQNTIGKIQRDIFFISLTHKHTRTQIILTDIDSNSGLF